MIAPDIAARHGIVADLRYLQRDLLIEASNGILAQVEAVICFTARGSDWHALEALRRARHFMLEALPISKEIVEIGQSVKLAELAPLLADENSMAQVGPLKSEAAP